MKTMISYYDEVTDITLTLMYNPKCDGSLSDYEKHCHTEIIDYIDNIRTLCINYSAYLRERHDKMWANAKPSDFKVHLIDLSK